MSKTSKTNLLCAAILGGAGIVGGVASGFDQGGLEGALVGGFVGAVVGVLVGLKVASIFRLFSRTGLFDRPVRRPDRWGMPLVCWACGWRTAPEGPWRIRDSFFPPHRCPNCQGALSPTPVNCPECDTPPPAVRFPGNLRQAIWGGNSCKLCGCEYDKWGRRVDI